MVEGNAERLGTGRGSALVNGLGTTTSSTQTRAKRFTKRNLRFSTALLDIVLASFLLTPRHDDNALVVQRRDDIFPLRNLLEAGEVSLLGTREHVALDGLEQLRDRGDDICERKGNLGTGVAANAEGLLLLDIGRADLQTKRDALK